MEKQYLRSVHDDLLHERVQQLFAKERSLQHQIILHIHEVDRRKLFLKKSYPSLFEYLVQDIGYSPASAQRRIDAARLMRDIPELGQKIERGRLNLSQISKFQKALRSLKKISGRILNAHEKRQIVDQLEGLSPRDTEVKIAQKLDLPLQIQERVSHQKDESVRLEITLSAEQMQILKKASEHLSHVTAGGSYADVIVELAERFLRQKIGSKRMTKLSVDRSQASHSQVLREGALQSESVSPQNVHSTRIADSTQIAQKAPIPSRIRKDILAKSDSCQFRDRKTGKLCGSKYFLQVDHIQPRWVGGTHDPKNLRVLCAQHNRWRYSNGV